MPIARGIEMINRIFPSLFTVLHLFTVILITDKLICLSIGAASASIGRSGAIFNWSKRSSATYQSIISLRSSVFPAESLIFDKGNRLLTKRLTFITNLCLKNWHTGLHLANGD